MKKSKRMFGIGKKLRIAGSIISICTSLIMLFVSVFSINLSTTKALENTMIETANIAALNVKKQLETYDVLFKEIAKNSAISNSNSSESAKYLQEENNYYNPIYNCTIDAIYNSDSSSIVQKINVKNYDFYKTAIEGKSLMSNPFNFTELDNKLVYVYSTPIISSNKPIGILFITFDYKTISDIVVNTQVGKTGSAYMLDKNGYVIAHKKESLVNVSNSYEESKTDPTQKKIGELEKRAANGESGFGEYSWDKVNKVAAFATIDKDLGWSIFVTAQKDEFTTYLKSSSITLLSNAIILCILASICMYFISASISKPIITMIDRMKLLAQGDLTSSVADVKSHDETRLLHDAVVGTIDSLNTYIGNIDYVMLSIANKNLDLDIESIDYKGDFSKIKASMIKIIEDLNTNMKEIYHISDEVANNSNLIAQGSSQLAQGATEQASSVEELSATITLISNNIKVNTTDTGDANSLTDKALEELEIGNKEMKKMLFSMEEIKNSSNEISKIIKLIEDIAFQTNILALNAAVEAARAGSAGKGFAVVADEVRNLASKSAEAAKSTTILIEKALASVTSGTEIADLTAESMNKAVTLSVSVSNIMKKITNDIAELRNSMTQILQGGEQISSVVQTNASTSEESAASAQELGVQAGMLKDMISQYKLKNK